MRLLHCNIQVPFVCLTIVQQRGLAGSVTGHSFNREVRMRIIRIYSGLWLNRHILYGCTVLYINTVVGLDDPPYVLLCYLCKALVL
jgi:hypothetical protein